MLLLESSYITMNFMYVHMTHNYIHNYVFVYLRKMKLIIVNHAAVHIVTVV